MGLRGVLYARVDYSKAERDLFRLLKCKPYEIATITPEKVQGCDLVRGEYGEVGSIINWRYTQVGEAKTAKGLIQDIDEEQQMIKFQILEGDVMEKFKDFVVKFQVETEGEIDKVTWKFKYETINTNNDDQVAAISLLAYVIDQGRSEFSVALSRY